jgi:Domain of unknown function (DUF4157)
MQSGAMRTRQRDGALPSEPPRADGERRPTLPGPRFAHDFTRVPVQAKLKVNRPGDSFEEEADRVANGIGKKDSCACGGECASCSSKRVQRMSDGPAAESADVDPVLHGPAHSLDGTTRAFMEPYFGHDFSRVQVHSDPTAAASADSLGARAYTVGHHLIFGPGEYRPHTSDGRHLIAHELTHVTQQSAAGPWIQRDDKPKKKEIKRGPASGSPTLRVSKVAPAKEPACACLVFVHHSEVNARLAAQAMYEHCHYNLAIVDPAGARNIDLPNAGERDPNELFPRHIFRECVDNDQPCLDFLANNKTTTDKALTEEYAQRDFFLRIKDCSAGFSLPIVALHNNVISDTANYRTQMKTRRKSLADQIGKTTDATKKGELQNKQTDLEKIRGKTFQDTPPETGPYPADTLPYADLEKWLSDHFPDLVGKRNPKAKLEKDRPSWKKQIESSKKGDLLSGGMTNIFKWCQAHDNSRCFIGDPDRPDNVVWVTREKDFDTLVASKPNVNVALQTRVTPGESETDLSSMFVGDQDKDVIDRIQRQPGAPLRPRPAGVSTLDWLAEWWDEIKKRVDEATAQELLVTAKRQAVRFVNIETPQSPSTPAQRVENYRDVKSILHPLGLHCCDAAEDAAVEAKLNPPKPVKGKK